MPPALLLDTHALLWWLVEPEKLSALAYSAVNDPAASIFVSAATGWELATKLRLGKLPGAEQLHHGVHAGGYRQAHRDPFDRLLAAQAELEGLQLVSLALRWPASPAACSGEA
ncbi:MAG: type II toxin-antitoxin system VapC family toxin [Cyanobacteriota bacterium]